MSTKVEVKNDAGITLVALIITIIVLAILAAVTVKALFNDKLVDTSIKAGEDYKLAQGQEMNELGKISNKLENVVNVIPAKEGMSAEELNTDKNPALIGKIVDYTPMSGIFNTEGKNSETASGSNEYSGGGFQYFKTQGQESGETEFTWKIWKADSNYLYLIADKATTKKLALRWFDGYNNGVAILDDICNSCYSNNEYGATAQNMKIEDILDTAGLALTVTPWSGHANRNNAVYGNWPEAWIELESNENTALANVSKRFQYKNSARRYGSFSSTNSAQSYNSLTPDSFKKNYYNLVCGEATQDGEYWLSSRGYMFTWSYSVRHFSLQYIEEDGLKYTAMYTYDSGGDGPIPSSVEKKIRPLVTIPLSNVIVNDDNNNIITLSVKN